MALLLVSLPPCAVGVVSLPSLGPWAREGRGLSAELASSPIHFLGTSA